MARHHHVIYSRDIDGEYKTVWIHLKNKEAAFVLSYFNNCTRCSDRTKNVLGKHEIQSRIFHAFLIFLISTFTFSLFYTELITFLQGSLQMFILLTLLWVA